MIANRRGAAPEPFVRAGPAALEAVEDSVRRAAGKAQ